MSVKLGAFCTCIWERTASEFETESASESASDGVNNHERKGGTGSVSARGA